MERELRRKVNLLPIEEMGNKSPIRLRPQGLGGLMSKLLVVAGSDLGRKNVRFFLFLRVTVRGVFSRLQECLLRKMPAAAGLATDGCAEDTWCRKAELPIVVCLSLPTAKTASS